MFKMAVFSSEVLEHQWNIHAKKHPFCFS